MAVVDLFDDDDEELEEVATCDRCRLEYPADLVEVVEFTELEELWCQWCREA